MNTHAPLLLNADIVIFGGGIAGLYLLNLLEGRGYQCLLLEPNGLGNSQTLHSQGIVHGGLKYALGGALNTEADAIKDMPDRWRKMLQGKDSVDLRDTEVLSETQYMWSAGRLASRFTTFAASKMLRGRIDKLHREDYPAVFQNAAFKGSVYKLNDLVINTESLLENLLAPVRHRALHTQNITPVFSRDENGLHRVDIKLADGQPATLKAQILIFSAGIGNEALCQAAGIQHAPMQRRPLHMVMMKTSVNYRLYAHCVSTSSKPRLTVTTHAVDHAHVWYLGGDIAETGVERSDAEQIQYAKNELAELFPWLDTRHNAWATLRIERAEPRQEGMTKPDCAHTHWENHTIVAWPTKLTLAPDLGDKIVAQLAHHQILPQASPLNTDELPHATLAKPSWETCF